MDNQAHIGFARTNGGEYLVEWYDKVIENRGQLYLAKVGVPGMHSS